FRDVILTKIDSESDVTLAEAVFDLYLINADDTETLIDEDIETNAQGQIRITGLAPGSYKFVETKAPTDYTIGAVTEYPFEILGTESETIEVDIEAENDIIKGSVEITKVDAEDNSILLDGVEFTLENISLVNGGNFTTQT